jgi:hypothetical protein
LAAQLDEAEALGSGTKPDVHSIIRELFAHMEQVESNIRSYAREVQL